MTTSRHIRTELSELLQALMQKAGLSFPDHFQFNIVDQGYGKGVWLKLNVCLINGDGYELTLSRKVYCRQ